MDVVWVIELAVSICIGSAIGAVIGSYVMAKYNTWRLKRFIKRLAYDKRAQQEWAMYMQMLKRFLQETGVLEDIKQEIKRIIDEVF